MSLFKNPFMLVFFPEKEKLDLSINRYMKLINDGTFVDKLVFGVKAENLDYLMMNPFKEPNGGYFGAMGSGKSIGCVFTVLTHYLANGQNSIYFLIDPLKGMNDYKSLFDQPNVYTIISDIGGVEQKIKRVIELVNDEIKARMDRFNKVRAESLPAYEAITGKKIARIFIVFEEFHSVPYPILDWENNFKVPGTIAHKFNEIMRVGRSYGVTVFAASQKSTSSDIPTSVLLNLVNRNVFRVGPNEAAYLIRSSEPAGIKPDQKGRCFTDYGECQYPYIDPKIQPRLIKMFYRPLTAEFAHLNHQLIKDVLDGKKRDEMYKMKTFEKLVEGIDSLDATIVVKRFHEELGHTIEELDEKTEESGLSHIATTKGGRAIAIMTRQKGKTSARQVELLVEGMQRHGCTRGVIYCTLEDVPPAVYKAAAKVNTDTDGILNVEVLSKEEIMRRAAQLDKKIYIYEDDVPAGEDYRPSPIEPQPRLTPTINPVTPQDNVPRSATPSVDALTYWKQCFAKTKGHEKNVDLGIDLPDDA